MDRLEKWINIEGYNGEYQINEKSVIKRVYVKNFKLTERILKQSIDSVGYLNVKLRKNGKITTYRVHRLVARAFIPNSDNKPCVNHLDGNKLNNNIENLEWCTYSRNTRHAIERLGAKMGSSSSKIEVKNKISTSLRKFYDNKNDGEKCKYGHEYTAENLLKRKDGVRACRICANINNRKRRNNNKITWKD
jgi:hypothetical protein